jgi:hypothetical protein
MSLLKLTNTIKFEKLIKFSKKQMNLVDDDWHHATLIYNELVPQSIDETYNSFDYTDNETFFIIIKYGVRTPRYMNFYNKMTDDEFYKFALDNINNKNFVREYEY